MKRLSGLDATFLYLETPEMPMHVGALNVFELPAGFKGRFVTALRRHMAERLPLAPALRRRLWWMPLNLANPAWVDAEPDLNEHIAEYKLPKSAKQGDGMAALEAAIGELHVKLLDRKRPLWKFWVLEGLGPSPEGRRRVGLYSQLHHAAVDGQAAVALGQVILDLVPSGRDLDIKPSKREKTFRLGVPEMLRGVLANEAKQVANIVKSLPDTVGTIASTAGVVLQKSQLLGGKKKGAKVSNVTLAPRTVLNQSVTAGRAFAGVSLPLAELKAIGRANDATINDMVLLICSTALRRYFQQHGTLPRKSLIAAVPISLREKGDTTSDNQASMSLISLGTHLADLRKRLAHVKAATAAMKSTMGSLKSILPTDFPSLGAPWLIEAATALYGKARLAEKIPQVANVAISNVPGPPVPLFMAGARMKANYPTSIVVHGMALNVTVHSYEDQLDFGVMADAQAMPDVRQLANAMQVAFDDLRALNPPPVTAAPGVAETGRAVLGQARRRLAGVVSDAMKGVAGSAVGRSVSRALPDAARGVVGAAVGQAVKTAMQTATRTATRGATQAALDTVALVTRAPRASAPSAPKRRR
ncbi:wax ester/triacylglycerol synthase family O-acyltransferase [Aquincola sp. S2]|uniref:diacylglycerol O-acyltransferase n=1 Tax=Pseudaquabacterium terrae TaxID=2732868 RepID=A0ABX2EMW7_9BURK|nr:wax ester/triacylglycerol synthase family O-acyltransferase [Aquabacterium terrae]NRF69834.1 wax ester/triacylglycerol synthase family O-acyltransferase [Aquabacterium terrae]